MKIAINRCHGGFGLSDEGYKAYLTRKGTEFETSSPRFAITGESLFWHKGMVEEDEGYLSQHNIDRDDPDLIAVIEELGDKANGRFSTLRVVDVPDDVDWYIDEYDGLEWVAEKHRTWK